MHNIIEESSEDTKGVTKNRKPTKNRQYNGHKKTGQ